MNVDIVLKKMMSGEPLRFCTWCVLHVHIYICVNRNCGKTRFSRVDQYLYFLTQYSLIRLNLHTAYIVNIY